MQVWHGVHGVSSRFKFNPCCCCPWACLPPAGNCVATGGSDGSLKLWDLRSSRIIQYYENDGAVTDAAFHPSGNFLLSSSMDGTLKASLCKLDPGLLL